MSDSSIKEDVCAQNGFLNDIALFYLKSASPWLRFLGIIYFIACGFMAVGGLVMIIAAPLMADLALGGTAGFWAGIFYLLSAMIMVFPARFMYFFGARLRNYFLSGAEKELELAFKYNKAFWKFCGITMIVTLALIPIAISLVIYASLAGYF
jgi:hypothetical protein